jgi:glycosyltransferase involved in cell wall biosynthesis
VAAPRLPPPTRPRAAVRAALGADDRVVALTVTRLAPQKNLGLLLDVAAAVGEVQYWVAGDGPERTALQARIAAEGLPVTLLGRRTDVADLLAAADLAILTSTWEARALVAQEALLAGLPLVSTRVGGLAELVGDAAVLVDPQRPAELIEAVRDLAGSETRRQELGERGRAQAATWPEEDDVVDDVLQAYEQARRIRGRTRFGRVR